MFRSKSLLVFACFALGFGFTQSASSQWWPATGTDTDNNWGGGGWGSFVEIYIDQAPLAGLTAPVPGCKGNPANCAQALIFGAGNPFDLPTSVPKLNGLRLAAVGNVAPPNCAAVPPMFDAAIIGNAGTTPPTTAVCIIRNDKGFLLPRTAAYCEVDVTVLGVSALDVNQNCVYDRILARGEQGQNVFGQMSSVTLKANLSDAGLDGIQGFPELEPTDVPQCDQDPKKPGTKLSAFTGACTLPIGLPTGVVCPVAGKPNCLSNLLPNTEPFEAVGQVLLAKEEEKFTALRYCVGNVGGGPNSIACSGGDKKVETAEADVVILCSGSHSPANDTINSTGNNTHKFDYLADCFPELDSEGVTTSGTIEFETVANDAVTSPNAANPARIEPVNECQFGGDTVNPTRLTCFVRETRLAEGCQQTCKLLQTDPGDPTTGCVDEIRGRAVVNVEGNDVPLIAIDNNNGNGFLCNL